MSDKIAQERDRQRQQQNRYAREVIAGSEVRLSHRPAVPQIAPQQSFTLPSVGSLGSARAGYLAAVIALVLIGVGVYFFGGFELASVILFILCLVLMAGWFIF
jgi:hypothetical protein